MLVQAHQFMIYMNMFVEQANATTGEDTTKIQIITTNGGINIFNKKSNNLLIK